MTEYHHGIDFVRLSAKKHTFGIRVQDFSPVEIYNNFPWLGNDTIFAGLSVMSKYDMLQYSTAYNKCQILSQMFP